MVLVIWLRIDETSLLEPLPGGPSLFFLKVCEKRAPLTGGVRKLLSFGRPFGIIDVDGGNIVPAPVDARPVGNVGDCTCGADDGGGGSLAGTAPLFECISFLVADGPGYPLRPLYSGLLSICLL